MPETLNQLCACVQENPGDASISTRKFSNYGMTLKAETLLDKMFSCLIIMFAGNYYRVFSLLHHIEGLINTSQQNNLAIFEVDVDFTRIWTKLASEQETDDSLDPAENDEEEASVSTHHYSKSYNWKLCWNRPCTVCYKQCILVSNVNGSRILCSNLCHGYNHCLEEEEALC